MTRGVLTYREYAALPDDGRQYEIHDGELSVTPVAGTTQEYSNALRASGRDRVAPPPFGDISLVTALWKVSLLILLGMAWATIGERPSALGVAGVLLSAGGVYLLNITGAHISLWEPLRVLVTDRGQRYTLLAAFFYAPSVITIKQAILASNTAAGTFGAYLDASPIKTPPPLTASARHLPAVPRFPESVL